MNIAGREGLNHLMSDVESKRTDFYALLVYDVSRRGRFQDVDESAYYEYVLKRAGIRVHYCAEQFDHVYHGNGGTGQEGMLVRGLGERRGFLRSVSRR